MMDSILGPLDAVFPPDRATLVDPLAVVRAFKILEHIRDSTVRWENRATKLIESARATGVSNPWTRKVLEESVVRERVLRFVAEMLG